MSLRESPDRYDIRNGKKSGGKSEAPSTNSLELILPKEKITNLIKISAIYAWLHKIKMKTKQNKIKIASDRKQFFIPRQVYFSLWSRWLYVSFVNWNRYIFGPILNHVLSSNFYSFDSIQLDVLTSLEQNPAVP